MPLDDFLGIKFFGLPQYFSYALFSKLFYFTVIKTKELNDFLIRFHKRGFIKGDPLPKSEIDELVKRLEMQEAIDDGSHSYRYLVDSESRALIRKLINKNMKKNINNLEAYFSSEIYLTNIQITKNFPILESSEEKEFYSENYHCDHYLNTYFKAQVLLEDVDSNQGPLNCFSKKDSLQILKQLEWKDRFNRGEIKATPHTNIGKKGDVLFFRPTECLHKAGIPEQGRTRTLITLIFQAIPKLSKDYNPFLLEDLEEDFTIWENDNDLLSKKFAKPTKISQLVSYFLSFIK